jgi:serine/threonine-protein kinase
MVGQAGSLIGPYKVVQEIGRGGMGIVYLARDTKLDRDVAIKVLPEELAEDAERLTRFEREAKLLASLHHANIAAVYGLEEIDGRRYLVLEYVDGDTLEDRLRDGPLPVDEAMRLGMQIAAAIEAAHQNGIVHRDLKPANVKFSGDDTVKVLDFGLAKALDAESTASRSTDSPTVVPGNSPTMAGVVLGTAGYLSPEQARGRQVDKRSDIWSFGCVLYEMLTGQLVFQGETRDADRPARLPGRDGDGLARSDAPQGARLDAAAAGDAADRSASAATLSHQGPQPPSARHRRRAPGTRGGDRGPHGIVAEPLRPRARGEH